LVPRVPLLPVDSSFGETEDVLKVKKVVLCGNLVGIVQQKSHVASGFGAERVAMIVVCKQRDRDTVGRNDETSLAQASWDMVDWRGVGGSYEANGKEMEEKLVQNGR
jgi:hypothetical protein